MVRHGYSHKCDQRVARKGGIRGHRVTVGLSNFEQTRDAELVALGYEASSPGASYELAGG